MKNYYTPLSIIRTQHATSKHATEANWPRRRLRPWPGPQTLGLGCPSGALLSGVWARNLAVLGSFGLVLTRSAPLKARLKARRLPLLEPFGPVLGRFGPNWACPKNLRKMIPPPQKKNLPGPLAKPNRAYFGQFGPVLRVKGWS